MNIEGKEGCTPAWLRNLRITKVALVDTGANQHANVTLYKRKETDMTTSIASQSVIFDQIRKRAVRQFLELTEPQAIDRYTTEIEEGKNLARMHSEATVDFEPEEVVTKAERVGGDAAERIAKRLDDAAKEYALTHDVGYQVAYDIVLSTAEGMELRQKYDALVRAEG